MNREEILAMEAGAKLDEIIAEDIFGITPFRKRQFRCTKCDWGGYNPPSSKGKLICPECSSYVGMHPDDPSWEYSSVPDKYSTDISTAWQVVEKMKKKHWRWHGFSAPDFSGCEFTKQVYVSACPDNLIEAIDMPEAICKAALLATMEKEFIPQFETEEQEAEYWDAYSPLDVTTEPKAQRVRVRGTKDRPITIRLDSESRSRLERLAVEQGLGPSTFARLILMSVIERREKLPKLVTFQLPCSTATARRDQRRNNFEEKR